MAIDPKELRQAQLIMLEMLVEFDAICQKHNLKYWLDSGTLSLYLSHETQLWKLYLSVVSYSQI